MEAGLRELAAVAAGNSSIAGQESDSLPPLEAEGAQNRWLREWEWTALAVVARAEGPCHSRQPRPIAGQNLQVVELAPALVAAPWAAELVGA